MYEKTISVDFRIYQVTLTANFTLLYNLFDAATKADYNSIINTGLESFPAITGRPHNTYKRNPIDGYIVSQTNNLIVTDVNGYAEETYLNGVQYTMPVWHWPKKLYVKSAAASDTAIVRIFFS